jgi:signal peptidase I
LATDDEQKDVVASEGAGAPASEAPSDAEADGDEPPVADAVAGGPASERANADAPAPKKRARARKERRDVERAVPRPKKALPPQNTLGARAGRFVFWLVWFVALPFAFALFVVWGLSPPAGVEPEGALAFVQSFVREQPVPVGIVAFTLAEMALWAVRKKLPLASFVHPPLRADVPEKLREPFERAASLLEEAGVILGTHRNAVARELSAKEREKLLAELDALADAMDAEPFDGEAFVDALVRADAEIDAKLGRWRKSEAREYLESILVAVMVALGLRAFVVEAFKIPSGSMIPTLQVGDHIFVNKFSYGPALPLTHARLWSSMPPKRGDVLVFAFPEHPEQDFIKRVVAIPGDVLEARSGHPVINGWEVPHCYVGVYSYAEPDATFGSTHEGDLWVEYLGEEAYLTLYDRASGFPEVQGPYTCKPGEVWVMGDNRNNSHDSRMWFGGQGGGVPFDNIRGRALFVWLSVGEHGIDWSRMGAPVMGRPRMPAAMRSLEPAIDKCLKERPPLDKTVPPPPPR